MDSKKPRFKIIFAKSVNNMFLLYPLNLAAKSACHKHGIHGFRYVNEGYKFKNNNNG